MYWTRKHVLICTASHCMQKGANNVAGRLRIELKRRGLDEGLMVNTCDSIDLCDIGPNIVVYPEGLIYAGVQVSDLPEIIEHITGGPPVDRLVVSQDSREECTQAQFYRAADSVQVDGVIQASDFFELAASHGFDESWIGEQARRGFIGRKELDNRPIVSITSKARARYRLDVDASFQQPQT